MVVTLAERKSKMMLKSVPNFAKMSVDCCVFFMLEIEEDPSWANKQTEEGTS